MKTIRMQKNTGSIFLMIFPLLLAAGCATPQWDLPAGYPGTWKTGEQKITVRTHPKEGYRFTSDSVVLTLVIGGDKRANGKIGLAEFQHGTIERNHGNPDKTGVAYIVKCGRIGKIFNDDPLESKEVELWLSPLKGNLEAELRYTEGFAVFPMGQLVFEKK